MDMVGGWLSEVCGGWIVVDGGTSEVCGGWGEVCGRLRLGLGADDVVDVDEFGMGCFEEGCFVQPETQERPELAVEDAGNICQRFYRGFVADVLCDDEEEGQAKGGEACQPGDTQPGIDEPVGGHHQERQGQQDEPEIGRASCRER